MLGGSASLCFLAGASSSCIPCDICEDRVEPADGAAEGGGPGDAALESSFCSQQGPTLACLDFDDGDAGLSIKAGTFVDPTATLAVTAAADAPSPPNVLRASGDGASLEAFGRRNVAGRPASIELRLFVDQIGSSGQFARVLYGGADGFGLRVTGGGTGWALFVKASSALGNVATFAPRSGKWITVRYDITAQDQLTLTIDGVVEASKVSIPPVPSSVSVDVGFAETSGAWSLAYDNVVLR